MDDFWGGYGNLHTSPSWEFTALNRVLAALCFNSSEVPNHTTSNLSKDCVVKNRTETSRIQHTSLLGRCRLAWPRVFQAIIILTEFGTKWIEIRAWKFFVSEFIAKSYQQSLAACRTSSHWLRGMCENIAWKCCLVVCRSQIFESVPFRVILHC